MSRKASAVSCDIGILLEHKDTCLLCPLISPDGYDNNGYKLEGRLRRADTTGHIIEAGVIVAVMVQNHLRDILSNSEAGFGV